MRWLPRRAEQRTRRPQRSTRHHPESLPRTLACRDLDNSTTAPTTITNSPPSFSTHTPKMGYSTGYYTGVGTLSLATVVIGSCTHPTRPLEHPRV